MFSFDQLSMATLFFQAAFCGKYMAFTPFAPWG
jgi:hypothetical protein